MWMDEAGGMNLGPDWLFLRAERHVILSREEKDASFELFQNARNLPEIGIECHILTFECGSCGTGPEMKT